ncbi:hypothetical protein GCM10009628_12350 [Paeniglutamicibacter kerguelensis]
MAGFGKTGRFELPDPVRRLFEGDWDSPWPRVEEYRDGEAMVVRAELPGIDPDQDADVSISNGVLTIKVERREELEHKEKSGYRSEFRYGSFSRSIPLPAGCHEDEVRASYRDGVLQIRVPCPEEGQTASSKVRIDRE